MLTAYLAKKLTFARAGPHWRRSADLLVVDTGDVWGLREACPWPAGVPLALFRAIQGHQARHQEREEKHARDRGCERFIKPFTSVETIRGYFITRLPSTSCLR